MIFGRRKTHEDHLATVDYWKHRAKKAESANVRLRNLNGIYLTERNEATARYRALVADRVNGRAS